MIGAIATAIIQATLVSAVYALIAIGFTMIFGVAGVLNLAHGALLMAGAYVYGIVVMRNIVPSMTYHPAVGVIAGIVVVAILSLLLYELLVRWVEDNVVITFLSTVILAVASTEFLVWIFGGQNIRISLIEGQFALANARVAYYEAIGFAVSWIAIALLWFYVTQTDDGRSILATSMSERGAQLTGVNIRMVRAKTWIIAGALAGLGGMFLGFDSGLSPLMWLNPLAVAFIAVVVGGIGSIKGSVAGAYLIGFIEQITVELIGNGFRGMPTLILLVGFLLFMPQGLFGREFAHE
ncbi:branched-chain amino acid ABC transporter permease [Halovenus sp. WSH3]|uniref:Branched-chain amino acid ABC transporter permease n=1 Tax=Halovenus carboxidivorans TaxID=2692199 RepID=A0A6B0TCY3_9EURY|nr:branched-chain amino acid ABC transporter permease [Halovenus carboxidivorans]MXR51059.1 branched-chain amino acid ABC transporter permease [Halovenus carboxidivorans]